MIDKDIEAQIDYERKLEWARESEWGMRDEWYSDNKKELQETFIKENQSAYDEFVDEYIMVDETYDMDYWRDVFCNEEMYEDFRDFCDNEYQLWKECD